VELALAGSPAAYAAPALVTGLDVDEREDVVWWAVVVGLAYGVALAWASWCKVTGGDPEIAFGWTGFKVICRSRS
jgi:hypothetical protein